MLRCYSGVASGGGRRRGSTCHPAPKCPSYPPNVHPTCPLRSPTLFNGDVLFMGKLCHPSFLDTWTDCEYLLVFHCVWRPTPVACYTPPPGTWHWWFVSCFSTLAHGTISLKIISKLKSKAKDYSENRMALCSTKMQLACVLVFLFFSRFLCCIALVLHCCIFYIIGLVFPICSFFVFASLLYFLVIRYVFHFFHIFTIFSRPCCIFKLHML